MKCKQCHVTMEKKHYKDNVYYWQCPKCKQTVGKPKEESK